MNVVFDESGLDENGALVGLCFEPLSPRPPQKMTD